MKLIKTIANCCCGIVTRKSRKRRNARAREKGVTYGKPENTERLSRNIRPRRRRFGNSYYGVAFR